MNRQLLQEALRASTTTEWVYLAEGGAHLVFAHRGTSSLLVDKVLRIRKEDIDSSTLNSDKAVDTFEVARQYFANYITLVLVPTNLLPGECRVTVDLKWIQHLVQASFAVRPDTRLLSQRSVPEVDDNCRLNKAVEVSLVENLLGGPGDLAVEIKPKCGFLPDPEYLSAASKSVKARHCRFCMHRSMREAQSRHEPTRSSGLNAANVDLLSGHVERTPPLSEMTLATKTSRWDYCPLDLFSTERQRRRVAVKHLFDSWVATGGKGNNFRVFVSGQALAPFAGPSDTTSMGISPGLSAGFALDEATTDRLCESIVDALDQHRILPRLKALQQAFDLVGIEELGRLSTERRASSPSMVDVRHTVSVGSVFEEALLADPNLEELDGVKEFWSRSRPNVDAALPNSTGAVCDEEITTVDILGLNPMPDLRTLLVYHGISAVFKDCSIIIRFPRAVNPDRVDATLFSLEPDASQAVVKLIDLDLKPLKKANKWYELDDQIWRAHLERISGVGQDDLDHPMFERDCCI